MTVFALSCLARFQSAYHLSQMYDPPGHVAALESPWHIDLWRGIRSTDLVPFSLFFASMQFAVGIASPFFVVYMLRDLKFSYAQFMINSAASVLLQFMTLNRWGRLSDLFGNRLILITTGVIIPVMPTLWLVSTNYYYLLGVQCISGLVWAGFSLSASNFVFDLTPPERRATLMAAHNVLAASAVFVGAVIGGFLGTHLPNEITLFGTTFHWLSVLYGVFLMSGLMRMIVAIGFLPRLRGSPPGAADVDDRTDLPRDPLRAGVGSDLRNRRHAATPEKTTTELRGGVRVTLAAATPDTLTPSVRPF